MLHIPGPLFLVYFIILSGVLTAIGKYLTSMDNSKGYQMPEPTHLTPLEISVLKGGATEASRIAILSLIQKKVLGIEGKGIFTKVIRLKEEIVIDPIESKIFNFIKHSVFPREIFRDTKLMTAIHKDLEPVYKVLSDLKLIRGSGDFFFNWSLLFLLELMIVVLGGTKLYLGVIHDRPSSFLMILLPLTAYIMFTILKPPPYAKTGLGERYLKRLKRHFNWIKESLEDGELPKGIDASFPAALFGVEVLSKIFQFGYFESSFKPVKHIKSGNSKFGGSCGSGCGGGADCGTGGCFGGCGGGCGGCGGCGG